LSPCQMTGRVHLLPSGGGGSRGLLGSTSLVAIGSPVGRASGTVLGGPVEASIAGRARGEVGSGGGSSTTGTSVGDLPVRGEVLGVLASNLDSGTSLSRGESSLLEGLSLNLLRVAVEEHVWHDSPVVRAAADGASEAEDLSAEEPPHETDRVLALVVGRDGHVDVLERRVRVAQRNDGDVDVRGLSDGLVVHARVRHDNQARLLERARDVVGERSRGESAGNGLRASVGGKLEDGSARKGGQR